MNLSTNEERAVTNQAPPDLTTAQLPIINSQPRTIQPAAAQRHPQPTSQPLVLSSPFFVLKDWLTHPLLRKLTVIGLTAQGLYGVYQSTFFVLIKFPELEASLATHTINQVEVNNIAVEAILVTISTILSIFFALHLMRNKAEKILSPIIGISLFLGNTYLFNFFQNLPLVESWGILVNALLNL